MERVKRLINQYPSLRLWADHLVESAYEDLIEGQQLILEFLHTIEASKTTQQLEKRYPNKVAVEYRYVDDSVVGISIKFLDKLEESLKEINDFMESFGWYPAFIGKDSDHGKYSAKVNKFFGFKEVSILYEPKYNQEIDVAGYPFLYHITPDIKWPKIKHYGLTSKSQGKLADHPGRVYLATEFDDELEVAFSLYNSYENKDRVKEMYLLEIDTSKLSEVIFFKDPNFFQGKAIWTYQNIPPNAIRVSKRIDVTY